jgi:AcrR family transcriptional regulator
MARSETVTREHVLRVAGQLFYQRGIHATGVADVIAAADCGKQALYRIFPSKDDLVAAYLDRQATERERRVEAAELAAGDDPATRLVAVTAELAAWVGHPGFHGCAMRNYLREHPAGGTAATAVAEDFLRHSRARVDRLAAAAQAGPNLARQVWLVHEGLYGSHRATPADRAAAVELVSTLVDR